MHRKPFLRIEKTEEESQVITSTCGDGQNNHCFDFSRLTTPPHVLNVESLLSPGSTDPPPPTFRCNLVNELPFLTRHKKWRKSAKHRV